MLCELGPEDSAEVLSAVRRYMKAGIHLTEKLCDRLPWGLRMSVVCMSSMVMNQQ